MYGFLRIGARYEVTLTDGKRYTPRGREIGAVEPSSLCSIEEAQEVIQKSTASQQQKDAKRLAYLTSPEGKREKAVKSAVQAVISTLNQSGWYADVEGEMDVLESELEQKIRFYVERHKPVS